MYVFCMPYNQCGPSNPVNQQTKLQLNTEKETQDIERESTIQRASERPWNRKGQSVGASKLARGILGMCNAVNETET